MNQRSEQFRSKADRKRDDVMRDRFSVANLPAVQAAAALQQIRRENVERAQKPGPFGICNYVL